MATRFTCFVNLVLPPFPASFIPQPNLTSKSHARRLAMMQYMAYALQTCQSLKESEGTKEMINRILIKLIIGGLLLFFAGSGLAQEEEGKLDDFAEDFGEDNSEGCSSDDDTGDFFLWLLIDNFSEIANLWGGTPETAFGPYPSFPYQANSGFMTYTNDHRSFFFTTEFSYHQVSTDLRSYVVKWETQVANRSRLTADLSVYEEDLFDRTYRYSYNNYLTFYGFRYGYSLYRSPQLMLTLEGGYRALHFRSTRSGPEIAMDMQLFPRKPLILEMELAAAYVGDSALYTAEASAGVAIGRVEILGGLRLLQNDDQDLLDGFRLGLRVWY